MAITDVEDISKVYDGEAIEAPDFSTNNSDGAVTIRYFVKATGEEIAPPTNAGEYTVKIAIAAGNTVKAVEVTKDFTISKAVAVYSVPERLCAVSGDSLKDIDLSAYGLVWVEPDTVVSDAGEFPARIDIDETNYFADDRIISVSVTIVGRVITKPTLNISFDNDDRTHSVTVGDIANFDPDVMEIVSDRSVTSAKATGTYTITIRLKDDTGTCWDDRTSGEITLTWRIGTFTVTCVGGTPDIYRITTGENGETTITFGNVSEKTEYSLAGELNGNIVIDAGDDCKFELSLCGVTVTSGYEAPIVVLTGDEVTISAKKNTVNYVYDKRDEVTEEEAYSSGIYSKTDLVIGGKGVLTFVSDNNNGIHTKDDLEVKNLTLNVTCVDNALKGNDSVTVKSGALTLISRRGDGIKTSNTDVSSKGNLRGTVIISGGTVDIYAACDGIDAARDIEISGGTVNIRTDKYSEYSEEVTAVSGGIYYLRATTAAYAYSVKYYNDSGIYIWKNAEYYTSRTLGGRPGQNSKYYYYKVEKPAGYTNMILYLYTSSQAQGQGDEYAAYVDMSVNDNYDTIVIGQDRVSWTNYSTASSGGPGFPGGPSDGNSDKGDHSTKGLKADNEIKISGGTVTIKAYDDAIHTNSDVVLESTSACGTGDIFIDGGNVTLYSNDDGIHADGTLTVSNGTVRVLSSYEGLEGTVVRLQGGTVSVTSTDDGINATAPSGEGIVISGGTLYVYAGGDGLDANSKTRYAGIVFSGGRVTVINTTSMNSPIDTDAGYTYTGGLVVAIGPSGSMWNEAVNCQNFGSVGCYKTNVASAKYILVDDVAQVEMPKPMTTVVIVLGAGTSNSIISGAGSVEAEFDENGVCREKAETSL